MEKGVKGYQIRKIGEYKQWAFLQSEYKYSKKLAGCQGGKVK
jgi:hypothetical protein